MSKSGTAEPKTTGEIRLHTNIGNREGVIVELPDSRHDSPEEGDMRHLTREQARELRGKLESYLSQSMFDADGGPDDE